MASSSNDSPSFKIILGSSSPARREILSDMGYEFTVMSADIDEKAIRREEPEELVKSLAEAKADAVKLNLAADGCGRDQPTLVITSDQVMVSQGVIRERPRSAEEAREFNKAYSGDRAFAVNYVLVTDLSTGGRKGGWDIHPFSPHTRRIHRTSPERRRHDLRGWGPQADASINVAVHQGTNWYGGQCSRASEGAHQEAYQRVAGSEIVRFAENCCRKLIGLLTSVVRKMYSLCSKIK